MNPIEKKIRNFWIALVTSILISLAFLICVFHNHPLSNNLEEWGVFGDYIGGFIGSIIAIANLYIFIQITMLLAKRDDEASEMQIQAQKVILFSQLRSDAIKKIAEELNLLIKRMSEAEKNLFLETGIVRHELLSFSQNNEHLFDFNKVESMGKLKDTLVKMSDLAQKVEQEKKKDKLGDDFTQIMNEYGQMLGPFLKIKGQFIQSLQQQLIEGLEIKK